jgi:sortase A
MKKLEPTDSCVTDWDDRRTERMLGLLKWTQRILMTTGLSLLAVYGVVWLEGRMASRVVLENFETLESPTPAAPITPENEDSSTATDFSHWAEDRVRAYKESLARRFGAPLAILQIPSIGLTVPLLDGTDDLTLNHAVGRIPGTARPGEQGNLGIAGHRDGFFRGLKDVKAGDAIELRTAQETATYVIDQLQIVNPDAIGVLKPRDAPSLTLVTCYPFYFVGSAPKRFVVTAKLTQRQPAGSTTSETRPFTQTSSKTQEEQ